jgi:hypothetical protein
MSNIKVGNDWRPADRLAVPSSVLKKYPGRHFVWARYEENTLAKKEGDGYEYPELTPEERKGAPKGKSKINTDSTDNTIRRGDAILMMIPEERYQARSKYYSALVDEKFPKRKADNLSVIKEIDESIAVEETIKQERKAEL